MKRRDFLMEVGRLAALAATVPNDWRVIARQGWADYPFALGVASGDPISTGAVIWTRLAPRPLDPDGGMGGQRVAVGWEVSEDDQFRRVIRRGRATAVPELAHSIHVDVNGLGPDRWYFYRFTANDAVSPVGRLRSTPPSGAMSPLRLAFNSCQQWEQGLYVAHDHLAREEIDLCIHLGDYIYEYGPRAGGPRLHNSGEVQSLSEYRARYALYKSDPALQLAHARCPWIPTWDDHEVDNNYANVAGENGMESAEQLRTRRAAAYQAWWEHQPVRVPRARSWADLNITRELAWGELTRFYVLDSRQYRSELACDGQSIETVPCGNWNDPARTLLGAEQEAWLDRSMRSSQAAWQCVANQSMLLRLDPIAGPAVGAMIDTWNGYPAARERLLKTIAEAARNRTVVITGDSHSNWVNELRDSQDRHVATEFLGTSTTSGGDGSERSPIFTDAVASENPSVRWQNNRRGYVLCEVTPETWRASFRTVAYVSRPGAPIQTASTWRLINGRPELERE